MDVIYTDIHRRSGWDPAFVEVLRLSTGHQALKALPPYDDAHQVAQGSRPAGSPANKTESTDCSVREQPLAVPSPHARVRKSDVAVILGIDEATTEILGWQPGEMVGVRSLDFIHPDDQGIAVDNWMQMLSSSESPHSMKLRHKHRDGHWVWLEVTNQNRLDDPGLNCIVADMVVIYDPEPGGISSPNQGPSPVDGDSKPLSLHEAIREREQVLHKLSEALPLGVLQIDALGRVVYTNRQLHTILNSGRKSTFEEQLSMVAPADKELLRDAYETVLHSGVDNDIEVGLIVQEDHREKDLHRCTISLRALTSETRQVTGAIVCVSDITESVRMREELRKRATIDHVTQCTNRASTMESLERLLSECDGKSSPAVIFIDLDRFKEINDHLGHSAGDELLGVVAKRLSRSVRDDSLVGRMGGDEFLVVCPRISTAAQALGAAGRIANALHRPIKLKDATVPCHASIGVAWSREADLEADTLIAQADQAMYEAKRAGSPRPVMYSRSKRD